MNEQMSAQAHANGSRTAVALLIAFTLLATGHAAVATRSFLWKASARQSSFYLVGSLHLVTAEYQIGRFDEMTMAQQEHLLAETLRELDTETANVTALADAWKAGDTATVERIVLQDVTREPQIYDRLLVQRNRNWMPILEG